MNATRRALLPLVGYSIDHQIEGCAVTCQRCGHEVVAAGYGLKLFDVAEAAAAHSQECTGPAVSRVR